MCELDNFPNTGGLVLFLLVFLICTWTLTFYGLKSTDSKTLRCAHLCCKSQVDCTQHEGNKAPGRACKWVVLGSFLHKSGAAEVGRDHLALVRPNPRQTELLSIQISPTAHGEPSSPSPAWGNGSQQLWRMSYFMEVMREVRSGAQAGSRGGFSPGKDPKPFKKVIFLSHSMF